jgi:hypothetical protein
MTFDDVRKIAAAFPGVEEHLIFGGPTLKVGKRFLACIAKIDPDTLCIKVPNKLEREYFLSTKPDVYYLTPHYENFECLLVRMSLVNPAEVRGLFEQAWREYAPKKLLKAYQESQ